jgi:CheY-like chemotaxis protein
MQRKLNCVLLIDDNESDNYFHKRVVQKSGITDHIEISRNGKEALEFITTKGNYNGTEWSANLPELILLDINMPVMDGWEFLEEYGKLGFLANSKSVVIILTTSLNPADRARAENMIQEGSFQYKPLTLEMINEIMESRFPRYLRIA